MSVRPPWVAAVARRSAGGGGGFFGGGFGGLAEGWGYGDGAEEGEFVGRGFGGGGYVVGYEVGDVAVEGVGHIAVAEEVEAWVHFLEHLLDFGVAVSGGEGVGEAAWVAVEGDLFFAGFFEFDFVVDAVDDGEGIGGAAAFVGDVFHGGEEEAYGLGGFVEEVGDFDLADAGGFHELAGFGQGLLAALEAVLEFGGADLLGAEVVGFGGQGLEPRHFPFGHFGLFQPLLHGFVEFDWHHKHPSSDLRMNFWECAARFNPMAGKER